MHSRFETHLQELDRHLRGLSRAERHEMRDEAAQHLSDLAAAHEEQGATEVAATEAALARFGDAKQVGQGIRKQILRRHVQRSGYIVLITAVGTLAGTVTALIIAPLASAPLIVSGHEIIALYVVLSALFAWACASHRPTLARGILGTFAACIIAPFASFLHQTLTVGLAQVFGTVSGGNGGFWEGVRFFFVPSKQWEGESSSLLCLLPALLVCGLLWARRVSLLRVVGVAVLVYALASPVFDILPLRGRTYLSDQTFWSCCFWSALLWAKHGALFGVLVVLARGVADQGTAFMGRIGSRFSANARQRGRGAIARR